MQNYGGIVATGPSGTGVLLNIGGAVTNAPSAYITGGMRGVYMSAAAGTVLNDGVITGTLGAGIRLLDGGLVTNLDAGSIAGGAGGVVVRGSAGTVVNDGSIAGTFAGSPGPVIHIGKGGIGVGLDGGGAVTNALSASITGGFEGVYLGANGTVINGGQIINTTTFGDGVFLFSSGSVINLASGSVRGSNYGVRLHSGGTLTNAGTIVGSSGPAVAFGGTSDNLLVLDPGYAFAGLVTGSPSAANTLELASAASAGAVTGLGTQFLDFGQTTIDSGAIWIMTGANTIDVGTTLTNNGTLELSNTSLFAAGSIVNNGLIGTDPSTFIASDLGGAGTIEVGGAGTFIAGGAVSAGETIAFGGANAIVYIVHEGSFEGTIADQGASDQVIVACFAAGTRILTQGSERPVEELTTADRVPTVGGRVARIVWCGHQRACVPPVRIRREAFAGGSPVRDLLLSPQHAVSVNGVLIPIRHLINGITIVQEPVDDVTYYHVELAAHDVILAEGLPCESYLDTGNRAAFVNGGAKTVQGEDERLTAAGPIFSEF